MEPSLLRVIMRDGILYYIVICGVNLLNVLIYMSGPEDLKAIGATFSHVMSTVMVCRLVMNLQGFRAKRSQKRLETTIEDDVTRTEPGILTTQFQLQSRSGSVLEAHSNGQSLQDSHQTTRTWFGSLGDRLTNEEWGTAGLVDEPGAQMLHDDEDWSDEQEIEMIPTG